MAKAGDKRTEKDLREEFFDGPASDSMSFEQFLIREGHELWLREQMKESFIKFTKSQTNIKLKIDRPRKRDTFKKTDKEISQLPEFITFDDIADKLWKKDKNLSRVYESQWETWKNNN